LDKTQLVTIAVTAVISVIAKELVQWLWGMFKTLSITNTIKAKVRGILTKNNLKIFWDIVGLSFYGGVLVQFALQDSSPTRLEILLMMGAAFMILVTGISLIYHLAQASIDREDAARQRAT
jgi:hypothetical protein